MAVAAEAIRVTNVDFSEVETSEAEFAQIAYQQERRRSFDPLTSVRMLREDIMASGYVLPETRERVRDQELSLLAEGVDRASRTVFPLQRQGDDLVYFKNGKTHSYTGLLITGNEVAQAEAVEDPRKQFLAETAATDLLYGLQMRALRPGEQMVWSSAYHHDVEQAHGADFMRSCGRFPDRKMGFLYRAYCTDAGTVVLESQTVDGGDADAMSAAMQAGDLEPNADLDQMVAAYDGVMEAKYGGEYYAGRRGAEWQENAWLKINAERDLVDYFLDGLESIAAGPLDGVQLDHVTKKHMYGVWAAFKKRIDNLVGDSAEVIVEPQHDIGFRALQQVRLEQEVARAFMQFAAEGRVMVGCGGLIEILQGEGNILNAEAEDVFKMIFGKEKKDEDKYGSLTFNCPRGHSNRRPPGKLIPNCKHCGVSVAC